MFADEVKKIESGPTNPMSSGRKTLNAQASRTVSVGKDNLLFGRPWEKDGVQYILFTSSMSFSLWQGGDYGVIETTWVYRHDPAGKKPTDNANTNANAGGTGTGGTATGSGGTTTPPSSSTPTAIADDFSGRWIVPGYGTITLTQTGAGLAGTLSGKPGENWGNPNQTATLSGSAKGKTAEVSAKHSDGKIVAWVFTLGPDGKPLTGTYRVIEGPGKSDAGSVSGTREGGRTTGCPATFAGEWGDWGANVGARRGIAPPGTEGTWGKWTLQVTGNTLTGSIPNMAGQFGPATFNGTVDGKTFNTKWKSARASGTLAIRRSDDDCTFYGTYTVDSTNGPTNGTYGRPGGPGGANGTGVAIGDGMILRVVERSIAQGTQAMVYVELLNAKDVLNLGFTLSYKPDVVTGLPDAEKGSVVTDIWENNLAQPGLYKFNFAQQTPINGNGTVAGFRFDAIGPARSKTPITLSVGTVNDSKGAKLPITTIDGSISVYDPNDLTDPNNPNNPANAGKGLQPTCSGTGVQTAADAQCCLKVWVGLSANKPQMDMNKDGVVDSADAVIILQNVARRDLR